MATKKDTAVKKEEKTAEKEVVVEDSKKAVNTGKTYILTKRKEDGMWALKYSGGEKVIKLFKTQKEALEFTKERAEKNDRAVLVRASKGEHKGKFHTGVQKKTDKKSDPE